MFLLEGSKNILMNDYASLYEISSTILCHIFKLVLVHSKAGNDFLWFDLWNLLKSIYYVFTLGPEMSYGKCLTFWPWIYSPEIKLVHPYYISTM